MCSDADTDLGSVIFTAAADDVFSQEYERNRRVCTSSHETLLVKSEAGQGADTHDIAHTLPAEPHVSTAGPHSSIIQRASSQQYQVSRRWTESGSTHDGTEPYGTGMS